MKKKILVIVSHPDDEILGCGGTIFNHLKDNDKVYIYFTHEGSSARFDSLKNPKISKEINKRNKIALKLAKDFKYKIVGFGDNTNLGTDKFNQLKTTKKIIKIIKNIKPHTIYTHFSDDLNSDHNLTHHAVISACRPVDFLVENIYLMEIPSSTDWNIQNEFKANYFNNINIKIKLKMLKYYSSEMRKEPHPRSDKNIEALSIYRGGQAGLKNSEAFMVYRLISK